MIQGEFSSYESETISVDTVIGITNTLLQQEGKPPVKKAICSLEGAPIRFWLDGTAPTASLGHLVNPGDVFEIEGINNIRNFKAIKVSGIGTLSVSLFN